MHSRCCTHHWHFLAPHYAAVVKCSIELGNYIHPEPLQLALHGVTLLLSMRAVVKCSIELGNYIHLSNYVQKAETTPEAQVGMPARWRGP